MSGEFEKELNRGLTTKAEARAADLPPDQIGKEGTVGEIFGTSRVLADLLNERRRQVVVEGFTRLGDNALGAGRLSAAAMVYAYSAACVLNGQKPLPAGKDGKDLNTIVRDFWSLRPEWFKPKTPREDLIRAGALIIAEIERIDRADQVGSTAKLRNLIDAMRKVAAAIGPQHAWWDVIGAMENHLKDGTGLSTENWIREAEQLLKERNA